MIFCYLKTWDLRPRFPFVGIYLLIYRLQILVDFSGPLPHDDGSGNNMGNDGARPPKSHPSQEKRPYKGVVNHHCSLILAYQGLTSWGDGIGELPCSTGRLNG